MTQNSDPVTLDFAPALEKLSCVISAATPASLTSDFKARANQTPLLGSFIGVWTTNKFKGQQAQRWEWGRNQITMLQ